MLPRGRSVKTYWLQKKNPSTGSVHILAADVADASALGSALRGLEAEKGPVDVAVCVAGLSVPKLFQDQTLEEAHKVMQVPLPMPFPLGSGTRHRRCRSLSMQTQCEVELVLGTH